MKTRLTAYFLLIATSFIWGIAGPISKYSFNFVEPFEFLFWRFLLASILALPILVIYLKKHPLRLQFVPKVIVLGILGDVANLAFLFWGLSKTTVIEATIIGSLTPLFVAIGSMFFLGEKLSNLKKVGLVLAISGSVVAVVEPLIDNGFSFETIAGNLAIVISGLIWMCFVMLSKKWDNNENIRPFHITAMSFIIATIGFFILSTLAGNLPDLQTIAMPAKLGIAYMAIFSSIIGFTAYETALTKINASEADIFSYLGPLWSIPLAIFWLGESFKGTLMISAVFILIGVIFAEYKKGLIKEFRGHHLAHHK